MSYAEEVDRRFFGLFGGRNSDQSRNDLKLSEEAQFEISITQENDKSIVRAVSKSGNIEESEKRTSVLPSTIVSFIRISLTCSKNSWYFPLLRTRSVASRASHTFI